MKVGVVLTAAGSGERLGLGMPKALAKVRGRSLLGWALSSFAELNSIAGAVITYPEDSSPSFFAEVIEEVTADFPVNLAKGGPTRQASVAAGLSELRRIAPLCTIVLVHDAARAFASSELFSRVIAAVQGGHPAVIPGLPVVDTIKSIGLTQAGGGAWVTSTPNRSILRAVQTPQGFDADLLYDLHRMALDRARDGNSSASDDAILAEEAGHPVWMVPGEDRAFKVTTPADLDRAERLVRDLELKKE